MKIGLEARSKCPNSGARMAKNGKPGQRQPDVGCSVDKQAGAKNSRHPEIPVSSGGCPFGLQPVSPFFSELLASPNLKATGSTVLRGIQDGSTAAPLCG